MWRLNSAITAGLAPTKPTPAPGKVILEVEAKATTRSSLPASCAASKTFRSSSVSS